MRCYPDTAKTALRAAQALFLAAAALLAAGCETMHYGVPESRWVAMSPEAQADQKAAYQAEVAREREIRRLRAEAKERERQMLVERIEGIYAGMVDAPLIRITITGGVAHIAGKDRSIAPAEFLIADGEEKAVKIQAYGKPHYTTLYAAFAGGRIQFDGDSGPVVIYNDEWRDIMEYQVSSKGWANLQNATVLINHVPRRIRYKLGGYQTLPSYRQ